MTNDIYEKAHVLADAIAQSSELAELRNTEKAMLANEEAQAIIAEFQDAQARMMEFQQNGQEPSEEDKKSVEEIETKVESNPLIAAYMSAQDGFTEMLDSVNAILANAIASDSDNEGCSSCGTDGGCSCGCGGC